MKRFGVLLAVALIAFGALASVASARIMLGTSGDDVIQGTRGDDYIRGRAGNDTIAGGGGSDVVLGGRGNDRIKVYTQGESTSGGRDDTVRCGPGTDYVTAGVNDYVNDNCEFVTRGSSAGKAVFVRQWSDYVE